MTEITSYRGKKLEDMTRAELIDAIRTLATIYNDAMTREAIKERAPARWR